MKIELTEVESITLNKAIELWGVKAQVGMVMEECGELLTALNRFDRGRATAEDVASEIADVIILMAQMKVIFGDKIVQDAIDFKSQRLIDRVESRLKL